MKENIYIATLLRFLRVFVSTGLAQLAIIVVANPLQGLDLASLNAWALILITAFVSGGLAGLDKALRFKEEQPNS